MIPHKPGFYLRIVAIGGVCLLFLFYAPASSYAFWAAIQLCARRLLPSIFPFMVLCNLLPDLPDLVGNNTGRSAWLPYILCIISSWLGGYLICANFLMLRRQSGQFDESISVWLLLLGCCSGPGFVVNYLGTELLGSMQLGWLLYFAQLSANLLSAAILAFFVPVLPQQSNFFHATPVNMQRYPAQVATSTASMPFACANPTSSISVLAQAIGSAAERCLPLCGCVVFYRVLCSVLLSMAHLGASAGAILTGCFEITSGCASFASLGGRNALYGICLCLSILGLSVFSQLACFIRSKTMLVLLFISRVLHIPLLLGILRLCLYFVPSAAVACTSANPTRIALRRSPPDAAILLFLLVCCVLYKVRDISYNNSINHSK